MMMEDHDNPRNRRGPVARLQGLYMCIVTELREHHLDERPVYRDKGAFAGDFPNTPPSEEGQRGVIRSRDRLVEELLLIMTGEENRTGTFRTIALGLAYRLIIPHSNPTNSPETLILLA